ncbi:hypothetical protein AB0F81_48260 [Actinoplanes sp. NPDC024001]|uniref:hypothetical protein n=1 Tax=Actinoplanes sp. NPDC024001 TaxID=3154598 RepID=UPI0033C15F25
MSISERAGWDSCLGCTAVVGAGAAAAGAVYAIGWLILVGGLVMLVAALAVPSGERGSSSSSDRDSKIRFMEVGPEANLATGATINGPQLPDARPYGMPGSGQPVRAQEGSAIDNAPGTL